MGRNVTNTISVTQVVGYHWDVEVVLDDSGTPHAQVSEIYSVQDDDGNVALNQNLLVTTAFSSDEQAALDALILRTLAQAATREQVNAIASIQPAIANIDQNAAVIPAGTIVPATPVIGPVTPAKPVINTG
jgi:hypothetical protein